MKSPTYEELFKRNEGYIANQTQKKIRNTCLLIAGCGVGSTIVEAAARIGFEKFILVDADTVNIHNLNRQAFACRDIGMPKVSALARRIKEINPSAVVQEQNVWVNSENIRSFVDESDFIFDTIDFLDIAAIVALHDEANRKGKPIISCVSAGWGAAAIFCPARPNAGCYFRDLFGLPASGSVEGTSYVKLFTSFIQRIGAHLDKSIVDAMAKALTVMEDGTPCPAPHVAAGSYAAASLAVTMVVRVLDGKKIISAPYLVLGDMGAVASNTGIDLSPSSKS